VTKLLPLHLPVTSAPAISVPTKLARPFVLHEHITS